MKSKINEVTKRSGPPLKPFDSAGHLAPPNKDGCGPLSSGPFQKNPSGSHRETDSLDEDLDLLLKLDAPVNPENMFASETVPRDSADLKMLNEENGKFCFFSLFFFLKKHFAELLQYIAKW